MVNEYVKSLNKEFIIEPYEGDGRNNSYKRAMKYIEDVQKLLPEIDQYASRLLGWAECIPCLKESYVNNGIDEDIFYHTMQDFVFKIKECRDVHGAFGLFVDWFFLFFELKMFALGRFQYEIYPFAYEAYSNDKITIKKGDTVYYCHIPSGGKLTMDMCMDSFQKAYEFFKPKLTNDIMPIISCTWLLYKPYIDRIYPENSNIKQFAGLFDIIDLIGTGNEFEDSWRVFNQIYTGSTKDLPSDNTLRRNFIKYIEDGGDFGYGYGIILYDGEKRKIVNQ